MNVTGAFGLPSVVPCWGMPFSSESTLAAADLAFGEFTFVALPLFPEPELPPSTITSTTATAMTTISRLPAIVSRCLRWAAAWAAASCSSRRCRAASLSALRDAI